jgi:hypothetical protein
MQEIVPELKRLHALLLRLADCLTGYQTDGNPYHDKSGRFATGGLHSASESGRLSASGANPHLPGFSHEGLDEHWIGGNSDHSKQYPGYNKEQYAQEAHDLIRKPVGGAVLGYKGEKGFIVRFDQGNGNFVKGDEHEIFTMFKPQKGKVYFHDRKREEKGRTTN